MFTRVYELKIRGKIGKIFFFLCSGVFQNVSGFECQTKSFTVSETEWGFVTLRILISHH